VPFTRGFGLPELIIILVIVLVIFGAGKLPEIGQAMGRSIRLFKRGYSEDEDQEKKAAKRQAEASPEKNSNFSH